MTMQQLKYINKTDKHIHTHKKRYLASLGLHNLGFENLQKKKFRVYNAHGLSKKIAVENVRIEYQSYIYFSPLSMIHLLGEFKNHLCLFIFNKVAKY